MNKNFLIKSTILSLGLNILLGFYPFYSLIYGQPSCQVENTSNTGLQLSPDNVDCFLAPKVFGGILFSQNTATTGDYVSVSIAIGQFILGWLFWWIVVVLAWISYLKMRRLFS